MEQPPEPPQIFLAHTATLLTEDRICLSRLCTRLTARYSVYCSLPSPIVGALPPQLEQFIEHSSVGLLAMNEKFHKTLWSRFELDLILRRRDWGLMKILAFWLGDSDVPPHGIRNREIFGAIRLDCTDAELDKFEALLEKRLRSIVANRRPVVAFRP